MSHRFLARRALGLAGIFGALLFSGRAALASYPGFRRPVDTLLSPIYSAYYDHDTSSGARDYACGSTTYDNHRGTDFRASVGTPVLAAKSGGLYYRYNDCDTYGYLGSTCGGGFGNHVRIDHEGTLTDGIGWVSIYAHLQKDTAVYPSTVSCGAVIGKSGSSGNSTGPHLHFEVRKYGYPYDDPFYGSCSASSGWWTNQNGGVPTAQCS